MKTYNNFILERFEDLEKRYTKISKYDLEFILKNNCKKTCKCQNNVLSLL